MRPSTLFASIEDAARVLEGTSLTTPLIASGPFSRRLGCEVHLKLESLQLTGSFKIRGAYFKMSRLTPEERARGVICASAGNHGQGVALAAKLFKAPAVVVMPEEAPFTKVRAIRAHGAEIVFCGQSYDDAYRRARELEKERSLTYVHAYDDLDIVAGQGTIGLEIARQLPGVKTVVVPIGGGGLISGIATAVKTLVPGVRVVGVVAAEAPGTLESWRRGERVPADFPVGQTIADGIRVKRPGEVTFPIIREKVDEVVAVTEDEIGDAVFALLDEHKVAVEGAGAAAVAAVLGKKARIDAPACVVVSGGNIDLTLLTHVIERGLTDAGTYLSFTTRVPDRPGQLYKLLDKLAEKRVNVLDVEHKRTGVKLPLGAVEIEVRAETKDPAHGEQVIAALREAGYEVRRP